MSERHSAREVVVIQYLRGIAALLVVAAHACDQFAVGPVEPFFRLVGQGGVDIFFVISGYVMTYTTAVNGYNRRTFLRRRLTRIVPLYWTLTLFTASVLALAAGLSRDSRFAWSDLFASLLFIPHYNAGEPSEIVPTLKLGWTLNYEMFFYAWFALAIYLSPARRAITLLFLFGSLIAIAQLFHPAAAPLIFWGNTVVLEFLFGCAVGCIDLSGKVAQSVPLRVWCAALVVAIVLFAILGNADTSLAHRTLLRGIPGAVIVLSAVAIERGCNRLWRSHALHFLGDASYSIYLAHLFAVVALRVAWVRLQLPHTSAMEAGAFSVLAVATGVALGSAVYLIVERPLGIAVTTRMRTVSLPRPAV